MHRGFTLLELLITVAVLTTMLLFAAPNFSKVNQQAKVVNLANELQGFLIQAKSEAVLRNQSLWVHIQGLSSANATGNWQLKLTASSAANSDPISLFQGDRYRNIYVEANRVKIKFDHVMGNPQISGSIRIKETATDYSINVRFSNRAGRIRICSENGVKYGYDQCE
ncbi:GspH/FimT family pseudopilin [Vibrio cholerae]|uniref:GspH/FimT family pseudopilin n=1 Tax=Vibrio cholerae TaxID=666 RepID=UPI0039675A80|nr:prepilin-type N-terminal cleavage/methylation domain-containing protein [Vibrio cholerae]EJY0882068.1 GspH/FimT family pseudopilin [Vibrio cholerae]